MRDRSLTVALGLALAAFLAGVVWVANRVLARAPIYQEYSTLRADPRGAKALHDTFAALPGLTVERSLRRVSRLADAPATVFWLGEDAITPFFWDAATLSAFEKIATRGGRLVIAFRPAGPGFDDGREKREIRKNRQGVILEPEFLKRWQLRVERASTRKLSESENASQRESALWLAPLLPAWRCQFERAGKCRQVERTFGAGTIVLLTDSFPLSNEGLRDARDTRQLAALAGNARRIVFDEAHLGVEQSGSMGGLIRQFGLEGAALMLAAWAALFIWRNSTSLLPARPPAADAPAPGDAHRSMTLLLRRSLAPAQLADACLAEWRKAPALLPFHHQRILNQPLAAAPSPLDTWRAVRRALTEKS